MTNSIPPVQRAIEELRRQRIEDRIRKLEKDVKSCDPRSLGHVYILGEENTTMEDARKISILIAQFELDCECLLKP